jgi:hypothetical protein
MNEHDVHDGVNGICLEVFGKLSASVTHEIKNTISIINENAGLLQDLCTLVEGEEGIPPERVEKSSAVISAQVARTSGILKNLNRFAHSNDHIPGQADLAETLELMVELTGRAAAMRKISVSFSCQPRIAVETNLLAFQSLLCLTLYQIYTFSREGSSLKMIGETDGTGKILIRFCPDGGLPDGYPGEKEMEIANYLGVQTTIVGGEVLVEMPEAPSS